MTPPRRAALGLVLAAPILLSRTGRAYAAEPEIFAPDGIAIRGIDPLGYFDKGAAVEGDGAHALEWKGANWRFDSDVARARFDADPMRYAPEFGGYCAFAASRGYLAPTIPEAWTVYEGTLYLNASLRARELWLEDVPGNIAKGRENWPGILG